MSEPGAPPPRVQRLGNGRLAVFVDGRRRIAHAVATSRETWIWLDGSAYSIPVQEVNQRVAGSRTDEMALAAPMPATVRAISVEVGQTVSAGDVLVTLEAMKMELPIKAPRRGVVSAVRCVIDEIVQPGVPLIEFE